MLISVWKQTLVDGREERDQVSRAAHEQVSLARLDFHFEGHKLRALKQNPENCLPLGSNARDGKKVMQFLQQGRHPPKQPLDQFRRYRPTPGVNLRLQRACWVS